MRILKRIGIALAVILLVWLVAALFVPKHFEYERTTDIQASKELVFNILNDLKTQEVWGSWKKEDPSIQNTYNEIPSGVGQKTTWTSEKSGTGTQTITASVSPTSVTYKIEFGNNGGGDAWFTLADGENSSTKATWKFGMDASYPFNLFMLFAGSQMNKMLEDGLAGLKELAEKKAAEAPAATGNYEVKTMDFPATTYLGIRQKTTIDEATSNTYFSDRIKKVMDLLTKSKVQPTGPPSGLYFTWDPANNSTDVAVAIPSPQNMAVAGGSDLQSILLPASKAIYVDHQGSYDKMQAAHDALNAYIQAKGLKESAPVIEQYLTDPETEKDTSKWLTKIIYMVKE